MAIQQLMELATYYLPLPFKKLAQATHLQMHV